MSRDPDRDLPPAWLCLLAGFLLASTLVRAPEPDVHVLAARAPPGLLARSSDPDRMSPRDLRRLPGIGEKRALAIARARFEQGLFGGPEAWEAIPGIGPETVRRIRRFLETGGGP